MASAAAVWGSTPRGGVFGTSGAFCAAGGPSSTSPMGSLSIHSAAKACSCAVCPANPGPLMAVASPDSRRAHRWIQVKNSLAAACCSLQWRTIQGRTVCMCSTAARHRRTAPTFVCRKHVWKTTGNVCVGGNHWGCAWTCSATTRTTTKMAPPPPPPPQKPTTMGIGGTRTSSPSCGAHGSHCASASSSPNRARVACRAGATRSLSTSCTVSAAASICLARRLMPPSPGTWVGAFEGQWNSGSQNTYTCMHAGDQCAS